MPPRLTRQELRALVRRVMQRGLPESDAEDVVLRAYEKAAEHFNPARGPFIALLHRAAENEAKDWWRARRRQNALQEELPPPDDPGADSLARRRAHDNQRKLLERLTPQEQQLFATWALQKHLPQGTLDANAAAGRLGMSVTDFNNAKRRLRRRLETLLDELSLTPRDLYSVREDEGPRRTYASRK